jgi:hypothetical protein
MRELLYIKYKAHFILYYIYYILFKVRD